MPKNIRHTASFETNLGYCVKMCAAIDTIATITGDDGWLLGAGRGIRRCLRFARLAAGLAELVQDFHGSPDVSKIPGLRHALKGTIARLKADGLLQ